MAQKQIQIKYSESNARHVRMAEKIAGRPAGVSVADYIADALEAQDRPSGKLEKERKYNTYLYERLQKVTEERDKLDDEVTRLLCENAYLSEKLR